ncbi:thioredoxin family protein [Enterococcus faecium]|uniref:thioredoxin family protein n=1 Tax=Enterococcus faecium TaxID=1352 RepID=UPI003F527FA6
MNLDDNMEFCNKFGVNALPTMIFFKGGQVKKTIVGLETEKTIRKTLEDLLKSA